MHLPMFLLLPTLAAALPRFEVHWESEKSFEDVDPLVSPWHIRLGMLTQVIQYKFVFIQGISTSVPLATLEVQVL